MTTFTHDYDPTLTQSITAYAQRELVRLLKTIDKIEAKSETEAYEKRVTCSIINASLAMLETP